MSTIKTENITTISLLGITVLAGILLTLPTASAGTEAVDTVTITVPSSCSMSNTIATGNEHTAEINNGQYDSAIGETTIKAFCNDNEGFAIYAIGYTDNELGKNVLTNSTLGSTHDIVTGTAIIGNTSNWAMKVSTITSPTPQYPIIIAGSSEDSLKQTGDPDFSNFTNVPDGYKKVAYRTAATDINPEGQQTAEGSTLKTTYQAYISPTQAAGEYTGQVKYTMLHPHAEPAPYTGEKTASGKICYYANASDSEGTMGCQTISASATSAELLASNFSRDGYGFAGWTNKYDYATNPTQDGIKFYGPQEAITFTAGQYTGSNKGLSLYAVWVKSQGSLQDSNKVASVCSELDTAPTDGTANLSSVSALTDQRDSQTYAIAKLADGKCWMIENLRLESTNSDNSTGSLSQGYNASFTGLADAESFNFQNSTTTNSLYTTESNIEGKNTISGDYQGYRFPRYNNANTSNRASSPTADLGSMYSYGNYYTWHAAIADTTYYSRGDHGTTSLCPTGWRLPIGYPSTADRSFGALSVALGGPERGTFANNYSTPTGAVMSTKFRSYPNNFLYSGYVESALVSSRGREGYYWSSTSDGDGYSETLFLNSSSTYPGSVSPGEYRGLSIRCLAL